MTYGSGARPSPLQPGTWLGPYQVLGGLGSGGMATVLHVFDTNGQRELALKLLAPNKTTAKHLERFRREGNLTASFSHPGIITVHDAGIVDGHPYIAYELVRGHDLANELEHLDRDDALAILLQVSEAVGHAHAQGVIHRDLKPANILIGEDGRARVADFGLAQASGLERLTLTGALVGTPTYMAPEQIGGERESYGPHTDVWALGVLLYRILTGSEPFEADGLIELAAQIADSAPSPPRDSDPSISTALEAVCLKALRKSHTGRYVDANAFATDLRHAMERRVSQVSALQDYRRSRRRTLGLGLLALVGTGAVAAAIAVATSAAPEPPPPASIGPQPDERERAARKRLHAQLDRALKLRSTADAKALERLLPSLDADGLAKVRAARVETIEALAAHQPLRPCASHTARLRALARVLSDRPPARLDALAASSLRAIATQAPREIRLLSRWADMGARLRDRQVAADLGESLRATLDEVKLRPYWDALVTFARLDIPLGTLLLNGIQGATPPWGHGTSDPWRAYVALRAKVQDLSTKTVRSLPEVMRDLERLVQILRGKQPPVLGPVHWANTASGLYDADEETFGSLLPEAVRRDPANPTALRYMASWLIKRDPARAVELAQRSRDVFTALRFQDRISTLWEWPFVLRTQLLTLATVGRRDEARKVYLELRHAAGGEAKRFRVDYPWLDPKQRKIDRAEKRQRKREQKQRP